MAERGGKLSGPLTAVRRVLGRGLYTEPPAAVKARKTSIFVRHLDGGSSNVFEAELVALINPVYDLSQYGIRFVASPRHADVLLITGPLTRNMLAPAQRAFAVMPDPKAIVTVGDYADPGDGHTPDDEVIAEIAGLFADSYATVDLPAEMRKAIIAHVPGDPPEPRRIIEALLCCGPGAWLTAPRRRGGLAGYRRTG